MQWQYGQNHVKMYSILDLRRPTVQIKLKSWVFLYVLHAYYFAHIWKPNAREQELVFGNNGDETSKGGGIMEGGKRETQGAWNREKPGEKVETCHNISQ